MIVDNKPTTTPSVPASDSSAPEHAESATRPTSLIFNPASRAPRSHEIHLRRHFGWFAWLLSPFLFFVPQLNFLLFKSNLLYPVNERSHRPVSLVSAEDIDAIFNSRATPAICQRIADPLSRFSKQLISSLMWQWGISMFLAANLVCVSSIFISVHIGQFPSAYFPIVVCLIMAILGLLSGAILITGFRNSRPWAWLPIIHNEHVHFNPFIIFSVPVASCICSAILMLYFLVYALTADPNPSQPLTVLSAVLFSSLSFIAVIILGIIIVALKSWWYLGNGPWRLEELFASNSQP